MKVLIAPNALKGSLDAFDAAAAIGEGLKKAMAGARIVELPVADGGDGTSKVIARGLGGVLVRERVADPLGRQVDAEWGLLSDGGTAVVEVAGASGLARLADAERDPMVTTSYGTGELVRAALNRGCRRIVVGLGGTSTVDGGAGFLEALGFRFLDAAGASIPRGASGLSRLARIDGAAADARLGETEILVACDVENALLGQHGAAAVFGPQKGATPEMIPVLEQGLACLSRVIELSFGRSVEQVLYGGAAGGMAAGLFGVLGAKLVRGIDLVLDWLRFDEHAIGCELVIAAEGFLDAQTLRHKAPFGVAKRAKRLGLPVVALAGGVSDDLRTAEGLPFDAIFSICPRPMTLEQALDAAKGNLAATAEQVGRLYSVARASR